MPPFFIVCSIVLIVLLVLFFLANRSEHAGAGLRRLSRLSNIHGWAMLTAAGTCKRACLRLLPKTLRAGEESAAGVDAHSLVSYVIARLLYLCIALAAFIGDFPLTRLRGAALFGIPLTHNGSLPLDIVNGMLWIAVPILCWATVWDLWEQMPEAWRVIPHLEPSGNKLLKFAQMSFRLVFAVISLGFLILAIVVSAYFLLWGQQLQLAHTDATELGLYVSLGFGLLIYFIAGVAFIALLSGVVGLVAVVLGMAYCILNALAFHAGFVGETLRTSADPQPQTVPPPFSSVPVAQPSAIAQISTSRLSPGNNPLLLPQGARSAEQTAIVDTPFTPQEDFMADKLSKQNITSIHLGNFGYRFATPFAHSCKNVGADRLIRHHTRVDLSRPKDGLYRKVSLGGKDITPYEEIEHVSATSSSPQQSYQQLMHTIGKSIVDSFSSVPVVKGSIVLAIDLWLLPYISEPLQHLHRRLPGHAILLLTALSEKTLQEESIDEAFECLRTLTEEGVIQNALFVHTHSPLAKRMGVETQEKFLAKALASLLVAHEHYPYNPTFGQVFEQCRRLSPCTVLSFAKANVAAGKPTVGQKMVIALRSKEKQVLGKGDLNDCISQTLSLFQEVDKQHTFAITGQGTIGESLFVLVDEPIPLNDPRLPEYVSTIQPQLGQTHPQADLIVVRGQGTCEAADNPGYYIQCSALRPLLFDSQEVEQEQTANSPQTAGVLQPESAQIQINGRHRKQSIG